MDFNSNGWLVPEIAEKDIVGFRAVRSEVDRTKCNIYAVDKNGKWLVSMFTEVDCEVAMCTTEALNTAYPEYEPTVTETRAVDMQDGSVRYFQVEV